MINLTVAQKAENLDEKTPVTKRSGGFEWGIEGQVLDGVWARVPTLVGC